jgi:hypothetical protein
MIALPTVKKRMAYRTFLSHSMTEPALRRRNMMDALTRGNIGMLIRLKAIRTYVQLDDIEYKFCASTYCVILVVIWFDLIGRYLPNVHANMPHFHI